MRSPLTSKVVLLIVGGLALCDVSFAGEEIPVSKDTIHEFTDTAIDYGRVSKRSPLSEEETETIKSNAAESASRGTKSAGDRKIFDQKASHFIRADRGIQTSEKRIEHLHECPVCVSMMRNLLRDTEISVVEVGLEFTSVVLKSPEGEPFEFNLDRNGGLHRIDSESGEVYPIPAGQLLREFGEWYATDGQQLEGPVEQTKGPKQVP